MRNTHTRPNNRNKFLMVEHRGGYRVFTRQYTSFFARNIDRSREYNASQLILQKKKRIVFDTFQDYISPHPSFYVFYLQKCGYIHLTIEKSFVDTEDIIEANHLFRLLIMET